MSKKLDIHKACLQIANHNVLKSLINRNPSLLSEKDKQGHTILHFASAHNKTDVVKFLIEHFAIDINEKDNNGCTALHLASRDGFRELVQLLIGTANVDINSKNTHGDTALHLAVLGDHYDIVEDLLSAEANVNAVAVNGASPLLLAAEQHETNITMMQLLLDYNANPTHGDMSRRTAIHWASMKAFQLASDMLLMLLEAKGNINAQDEYGSTPLVWAARSNSTLVELVMTHKGDINSQNQMGENVLFRAFRDGCSPDTISTLMKHPDCNLDIKNKIGETPLHHLCRSSGPELFNNLTLSVMLVEAGAAIDILNNDRKPALDYCQTQVWRNSLIRSNNWSRRRNFVLFLEGSFRDDCIGSLNDQCNAFSEKVLRLLSNEQNLREIVSFL